MITHLEPDILECEVKWALGSITMNKASGGDGIPVDLFQILKDDAVKVLHSICQQIWKTQQWPQDWKRSVSIPIPKKVKVQVTQLCPTLCDPMDYTILQSRILEWVVFTFSQGWESPTSPQVGDLPNPGIEPGSPALQADALWATRDSKNVQTTAQLHSSCTLAK